MATIFFSWQADRSKTCGKNFLERALEIAVKQLNTENEVVLADRMLEVDTDTKGVPGSPAIVDTILRKIDECRVFIADLTFVGARDDGRLMPNPNVLIEYGWTLRSKGTGAIIGVMNTAHGAPDDKHLPFDLRHQRRPLTYHLKDDADESERQRVRQNLVGVLKVAIRDVLASSSGVSEKGRSLFSPREPEDGHGRLVAEEDAWGATDGHVGQPSTKVRLAGGSIAWLRLYPKYIASSGPMNLSNAEMSRIVRPAGGASIDTLCRSSLYGYFRRRDGVGTFGIGKRSEETTSLAVVFDNGELWAADRLIMGSVEGNVLEFPEELFFNALKKFVAIYRDVLRVELPWVWQAGLEGLEGMRLRPWSGPRQPLYNPSPACHKQEVIVGGEVKAIDARPNAVLQPFVEAVYDAFACTAPLHLFE